MNLPFGFRSYRSKLQAAFIGLAMLAIVLTGWEATVGGAQALRAATSDRLTALRQTRCRQIERYFQDLRTHVLALAADESTVEAVESLGGAFRTLPATPSMRAALEPLYANRAGWLPAEPNAQALQFHYIAANPHPPGAKDRLVEAPGTGKYGEIHAKFHPTFHRYQSAFGFYDVFLIDASGRVLYTVFKETDLGVPLRNKPYADTSLAGAWRRAMAMAEPEQTVLEDYADYPPSKHSPAAFVAAPVWRAGQKTGVLAIQVSIDEVNRVMTGDAKWREDGFGETGQAYLVDENNVLRSDPREHGRRTRVLTRYSGEPVSGSGTSLSSDGTRLRSWSPLGVPQVRWTLVAEIDTAEALAPIATLRLRIIGYGGMIAAACFLIARWLGQEVTAPVLALAENARRLGGGDFGARIAVDRADEIGQLAASFNRMAEDLERTTVSKEAVDAILASMLNAVFVVEDGTVTRTNPAAEKLLGYTPGMRLDAPAVEGGPREMEILRADGGRAPVLLTAAVVQGSAGVVYAAQDISELRRLAGRLIAAQEDERRRIARELHDDFSQRLAAAAIDAGRRQDETARSQLAAIADELHALSRRLHPAMLDDLGLEAAMQAECRAFFERGGAPVDFRVTGETAPLRPEVALSLYRILQEALRNAGRHANAQQVIVRLEGGESSVRLEIADDGKGFGPDAARGLGLASMEERVRLLGGRWTMEARPGAGVRIVAEAPR